MKYCIFVILTVLFVGIVNAETVNHQPVDSLKVMCRTPNGAIIVVEGVCPAGTTYVGPA